jgi:hypothetical protein
LLLQPYRAPGTDVGVGVTVRFGVKVGVIAVGVTAIGVGTPVLVGIEDGGLFIDCTTIARSEGDTKPSPFTSALTSVGTCPPFTTRR